MLKYLNKIKQVEMYDYKLLIDKAKEASKMSYSPFSGFAVGACVLTKSGKIYSPEEINYFLEINSKLDKISKILEK